jgi:hypothetical protein
MAHVYKQNGEFNTAALGKVVDAMSDTDTAQEAGANYRGDAIVLDGLEHRVGTHMPGFRGDGSGSGELRYRR